MSCRLISSTYPRADAVAICSFDSLWYFKKILIRRTVLVLRVWCFFFSVGQILRIGQELSERANERTSIWGYCESRFWFLGLCLFCEYRLLLCLFLVSSLDLRFSLCEVHLCLWAADLGLNNFNFVISFFIIWILGVIALYLLVLLCWNCGDCQFIWFFELHKGVDLIFGGLSIWLLSNLFLLRCEYSFLWTWL